MNKNIITAVLIVLCIYSCFVTQFVMAQDNIITLRANEIIEDTELVQDIASVKAIKYEETQLELNDTNKVFVYTIEDDEIINKDQINESNTNIQVLKTEEKEDHISKDQEDIPIVVIPNNTGIAIEEIIEIHK